MYDNMGVGQSTQNVSSTLLQQAGQSSALVTQSMQSLLNTIANAPPGVSSTPVVAPVSSDPFYSGIGFDPSGGMDPMLGLDALGATNPSFNAGYSGSYGSFYGGGMDPYGMGMDMSGGFGGGDPLQQMNQLDQAAEYDPLSCGSCSGCGCSSAI